MSIKLDELELLHREQASPTDPIAEIRTVYAVQTLDHRNIVELRIPGSQGGVLQDLGREPVRIRFKGMMSGPDAKVTLKRLQKKLKAGIPLQFSSDLVSVDEVDKVLIEDLSYQSASGEADRYTYRITLKEYREPEVEEEAPRQEAEKAVEKESDIHDIEGRVLDIFGNPVKDAPIIAKSQSGEYTAKTNEKGVYWFDDVDEGVYKITIDHSQKGFEDYKGLESTVEVKKGGKRQT